ncbi:MAG TPA: ABC-F family ATP-binding cassette domain-containing protein [Candidatus Babeliales bacterium]|nr:ABC-F family ATP-binding cassette domain-containing protein [Candidatus Babeliales bacterium]
MIQAHNICLSFGDQAIFDHISFTINQDQRIGLVGRNGSGKTTLLRAIIDSSQLDEGAVSTISSKKIAYMPQEVVLLSTLSILDETCTAFERLHIIEKELSALEAKLKENNHDTALLEQYAQLQAELLSLNPEALRAQAKKLLNGLGFSQAQFDQPVANLSVGWKMRVVLAKLLLQDADFYLFDEPTNHLDLMAKEWFLDFIKNSSAGFMLVCHERYFLDELCTDILELEFGKGNWYSGNYSSYLVQKEHNIQLLEAAYLQQQKEIKRKQETIERFRAKASKAKMAQSMIKALDKIERITLPPSPKNVNFSFPPVQQAGRIVLTVSHVAHTFDNKQLFKQVSFEIERGQKVALIAPNGVGKTTLFNIITGKIPLQKGTITFGYNVMHAIFAQDQNKMLNLQMSIIDNIKMLCPKATEQTIRTFLGAFLFSNDDVHKKVGVLSGGEKNRVGMVSVLLQNANFLLLDEPTNHLDIPSKEILLKALKTFTGTVLFVSHDRDFVNDLATHVIDLNREGSFCYEGNYDSFVYQKRASMVHKSTATATSDYATESSETKKQPFELQKKSKRLEEKISRIEQQIQGINMQFADLEYGTAAFSDAQKKLKELQQELRQTESEWEQVQKEILET